MTAQGVPPFEEKEQGRVTGLTATVGFPAYLDLAQVGGMRDAIRRHVM
ncbi:hypothetical protein [Desulfosoma caldarium]|uniref:Uncharacterized protein n=1 Tax=Desulfosoma caldarium TaxID=610254 RepID=A0A3N1UM94_9BACT|nr:hypothetical protein [Desulfosoma caldarium]ROQ92332.1 hypothetical protein EDC27_2037 [Desulfosoma caldarium]